VQRQQDDWAVSGLYHLSASGSTSWYGFAREIIAQYQALYPEQALMVERILPISTSEYPTPAQRPANSVLDNSKLLATFGLQLPDWPDSLTQVLSGIKI
jgi:dTDP-4-dehydrorhamnose reductase